MTETTTIAELKTHGVDALEELVWDETEPLRPGLDYRDGVVYMTLPVKRNVEKTEGRGKAAKTVIELQDDLGVVTSDGRSFPYTAENCERLGFTYPDNVTNPKVRRWSRDSIVAYLTNDAPQVQPAMLHASLKAVYEEYVEFANPIYYDLMPLFVMGTYMFRLYKSLGYIHFNGTAASGKSQNLRILEAVAFNPVWASSMSAAALYRQLAGFPGTIMLDEAEGFEGERGEELRRILNAGYQDGSSVKRAEKGKNDQFHVQSFDSYGPKVIAGIAPLDYVIGSRCLIVGMRPALRTINEFDKDELRWQRLRDRLYLWAMQNTAAMAEVVERWNTATRYERAGALVGRQWQITQLYITIADFLDQQDGDNRCDRLIAFFNVYFADLQRAQDATDRIRIVLKCLPRVLANNLPEDGGFYTLKVIHEEVTSRLDADAVEYYKTRSLGKHLDVLGFKNKRAKKGGTQVWLDPTKVREEFRQRRVDPYDEDRAWLDGEVDYDRYTTATPTPVSDERLSMWADAQEEPNGID
jgi:hypothetical protein